MQTFEKNVVPVRVDAGGKFTSPVWVTITFDGGRLSITGVVGPLRSGDALGSCGQCSDALLQAERKFMPGWTPAMVDKLHAVWDRWHLNDTRAGSPRQMAALHDDRLTYEDSCALLAQSGLLHDTEFWWDYKGRKQYVPTEYAKLAWGSYYGRMVELMPKPFMSFKEWLTTRAGGVCDANPDARPYLYGSAHIFEPIPQDVYDFLVHLPAAGGPHPWQ